MKSKKALLLLSGGFDSPVAGLLAQEKGFELGAVHFDYQPFTDDSALEKCKEMVSRLKFNPFFVVPFKYALKELSEKTWDKYYFVLSKRLMLKMAEKIALEKGFDYLITGESLAQVSSQTMENLNVITFGIKLPVLRPVISMSKQEIIDLSSENGLFEMSKGKELCDPFSVKKPFTKSKLEEVLKEEEKEDLKAIINNSLKEMKEFSLGTA